jgi:predicted alpha/beta-fold hydrolase
VQTVVSFFLPRRIVLPPAEERMIEVEPGVRILCHCHWQQNREQALTVIILHGLEGSSDSQYMLGVAQKGLAAGMNVVRMNQRNCGGLQCETRTLYHSGRSQDVVEVVKHFIARDRISRFALAGYSMGGNIVLKCAGDWGREAPPQFRGVAAVCPAVDLAASADALHLAPNRLYEYYFVWKLRRRMQQKARQFPGAFDLSRLRGIRSLRDFDDRITAHYSGFTGADDYYYRAAAARVIDRVAVPALIIHAANDPFIRITPETRRKILANRHIRFIETEDGGHCSFLAEPGEDDGHWAEQQIMRFVSGLEREGPFSTKGTTAHEGDAPASGY